MTDNQDPGPVELGPGESYAIRLAEAFAAVLMDAGAEEAKVVFTSRVYELQATPPDHPSQLEPVWVKLTGGGNHILLRAQLRITAGSITASFHAEGVINGEQRHWTGLGNEDEQGNARIASYQPG